MRFTPIWPKRQCHKYVVLSLFIFHLLVSMLWMSVLLSRFNKNKPFTADAWP
jgi:hypothetical protein